MAFVKMPTWRRLEVVITRTTRNRFAFTGTWVRIPPSPLLIADICFYRCQFFCSKNYDAFQKKL